MRKRLVPQLDLSAPKLTEKAAALADRPDVREYVRKANSAYQHWEDVRYRPRPEGLSPEEGWLTVKWSRRSCATLPLLDPSGRPFTFWLPESVQRLLHQIDRHAGDLLSFGTDDPELLDHSKTRILVDSHMDEAIATSQIEGAVTTRQKAKEMLRAGRSPRDRSEQMIANGYRTIRLLAEHAKHPMSHELLWQIQASMTDGTLDDPSHSGRYRSASDPPIYVVDTRDDEVVFTPPPAELVEKRMSALIDFANQSPQAEPFIHPLVRASILHFWLAYEHPFNDGNGRTARALFYWYMLKNGYWLFEFLTISRVINDARMQYYRAFMHTESDENDLTYFLAYNIRATGKAIEQLRLRIADLAKTEREMRRILGEGRFNARQRAVLAHALRHPAQIYTFESHRNSHDITLLTARRDLLELVEKGFLHEVGGQRPREFAPAPNLRKRLRR